MERHRILAHRLPVVFSERETERQRWRERAFGLEPFAVSKCPTCGAMASYTIDSHQPHEELIWFTFFCGECGERFDEPPD